MADHVVDVSRLRRRIALGLQLTGVDRVATEYLRWCLDNHGATCFKLGRRLVFVSHTRAQRFLEEVDGYWQGTRAVRSPGKISYLARNIRDTFAAVLGAGFSSGPLIFNVSHTWLQEQDIWDQVARLDGRVVTFIHDLIPISHPEFNRPHAPDLHRVRLSKALTNSAGIIVNSDYTRACVSDYAASIEITPPPLSAAHLGARSVASVYDHHEAARPYFVILGTIEPRKNHRLLLDIWKQLVAEKRDPVPLLYIVGKVGWDSSQLIDQLEDSHDLEPYVHLVHDASDAEVDGLISGSQALLFPSFVEGYGLPLVEALAHGVKAIASPLPPFIELAGDLPEYVDPSDTQRWKEQILNAMQEAPVSATERQQEVKRIELPTWADHFGKIETFIGQHLA
jgi:glycosyltransferase involved in cell wall biosynthesis